MPKIVRLLILFVLLLAFYVRTFGINWDFGFHLHPDERMIIMVSDRINLPSSFKNILSSESSINPDFFAYGSFPIYLLSSTSHIVSTFLQKPSLSTYDGMLYVGRFLSIVFDLVTTYLVFRISLSVFGTKRYASSLLSSFFYAIAVLPIQASHFFAVDIMLTCLTTLTLFILIRYIYTRSFRLLLVVGVVFGLSIATKITMSLLAAPIVLAIVMTTKGKNVLQENAKRLFILFLGAFSAFVISMPYAVIDRFEFIKQIGEQLKMNSNPYIFPFTLQYVNTAPYAYYIVNLVTWGFGLPLGILLVVSVIVQTYIQIKKLYLSIQRKYDPQYISLFILIVFLWMYFLIVGKSAVKFMRYMLPLYPLFCLFGGVTVITLGNFLKKTGRIYFTLFTLFVFSILIWPFSFITIYSKPPTRVEASNWILSYIQQGDLLAVEHWDDRLPLFHSERFTIKELPLYEKDSPAKWEDISKTLEQVNYIVIASNRLYIPLQKLDNCQIHTSHCYPLTKKYYQALFNEELGFKKVAEFSNHPRIPYINLVINDQTSDESFTVYDHPTVMIYKKSAQIPSEELFSRVTK